MINITRLVQDARLIDVEVGSDTIVISYECDNLAKEFEYVLKDYDYKWNAEENEVVINT